MSSIVLASRLESCKNPAPLLSSGTNVLPLTGKVYDMIVLLSQSTDVLLSIFVVTLYSSL